MQIGNNWQTYLFLIAAIAVGVVIYLSNKSSTGGGN